MDLKFSHDNPDMNDIIETLMIVFPEMTFTGYNLMQHIILHYKPSPLISSPLPLPIEIMEYGGEFVQYTVRFKNYNDVLFNLDRLDFLQKMKQFVILMEEKQYSFFYIFDNIAKQQNEAIEYLMRQVACLFQEMGYGNVPISQMEKIFEAEAYSNKFSRASDKRVKDFAQKQYDKYSELLTQVFGEDILISELFSMGVVHFFQAHKSVTRGMRESKFFQIKFYPSKHCVINLYAMVQNMFDDNTPDAVDHFNKIIELYFKIPLDEDVIVIFNNKDEICGPGGRKGMTACSSFGGKDAFIKQVTEAMQKYFSMHTSYGNIPISTIRSMLTLNESKLEAVKEPDKAIAEKEYIKYSTMLKQVFGNDIIIGPLRDIVDYNDASDQFTFYAHGTGQWMIDTRFNYNVRVDNKGKFDRKIFTFTDTFESSYTSFNTLDMLEHFKNVLKFSSMLPAGPYVYIRIQYYHNSHYSSTANIKDFKNFVLNRVQHLLKHYSGYGTVPISTIRAMMGLIND